MFVLSFCLFSYITTCTKILCNHYLVEIKLSIILYFLSIFILGRETYGYTQNPVQQVENDRQLDTSSRKERPRRRNDNHCIGKIPGTTHFYCIYNGNGNLVDQMSPGTRFIVAVLPRCSIPKSTRLYPPHLLYRH